MAHGANGNFQKRMWGTGQHRLGPGQQMNQDFSMGQQMRDDFSNELAKEK